MAFAPRTHRWRSATAVAAATTLAVVLVATLLMLRLSVRREHPSLGPEPFTLTSAGGGGGPSDATTWLRDGILSLGRVPQLRLPGAGGTEQTPGADLVPVRESTVWRDTLAPERDGLFVVAPGSPSLAELVVNERHPYAAYLRDFDEIVQRLRASGRNHSVAALGSTSMRDLEARAFESVVDREDGVRVYTLVPEFAKDADAARAAYAVLFAASGARACIVNGSSIDAVLSGVADLASVRERNARALDRIHSHADADFGSARAGLESRFEDERSRMQTERVRAEAHVSDLTRETSAVSKALSESKTRQAGETVRDTRARSQIAAVRGDENRAKAELEDLAVERGGVGTELAASRRRAETLEAARRASEVRAEEDVRAAEEDMARARATADRKAPGAQRSVRDREASAAKMESTRAARDAARGRLEAATRSSASVHEEAGRARSMLDKERRRGDTLASKHATVAANIKRAGRAQDELARRAKDRLGRAMDANNETQGSYALWGRYASLTRLEDELDAHDDGLPGVRAP